MPDFPRGGSAADVWGYATRQLTQDALNVIRDAILNDATKIPGASIDAAISSRATQAQILSDATPFAGANVDQAVSTRAAIADYTAARAAKIDKVQNFLEDASGTLTADGTLQTVREITATECKLHCFIDLTLMQAGDTVVIRQSIQIKAAGSYAKYAEETYSGAQSLPMLYIITKPAKYGIKVTLQQTGGVNRDYDWETFKEQAA